MASPAPYDRVDSPALPNTAQSNRSTAPRNALNATFAHQADDERYSNEMAAGCYIAMMSCLGNTMGFCGSVPCCCCCPNPYTAVQQGFVGLFSRFGRYTRTVDPGLHYVNPLTEKLRMVDVKVQTSEIPRQSVITKDNVTISIDSVLYWDISEPYTAIFHVSNVGTALIERTMTTLRQVIGSHDLQDMIVNRDGVAHEIQRIIEPPAGAWGVHIESILIKDLNFSAELQENLSAAAKQRRLGASKIIAAQAEVESAKLMREAADILASPAAMQIRYLETLTKMASESGSKVIFMPPSFNEVGGPIPANDSTYPGKSGKQSVHPDLFGFDRTAILETVANSN